MVPVGRALSLVCILLVTCTRGVEVQSTPFRSESTTVRRGVSDFTNVRSIAFTDNDWSDLAPLAAAVARARIVVLNESHDDGTSYRAKARVARFLHEACGFNVLVFEGSFFECREIDRSLQDGNALDALLTAPGISHLWRSAAELAPLFEYVATSYATARPFRIAGMDCYFGYFSELQSGFRRGQDPSRPRPAVFEYLWNLLHTEVPNDRVDSALNALESFSQASIAGYRGTEAERTATQAALAVLDEAVERGHNRLRADLGPEELGFLTRLLDNIRLFEEWLAPPALGGAEVTAAGAFTNPRDLAMARTLEWIALTQFPSEKIVVWTGGFHGLKRAAELQPVADSPSFFCVHSVTEHVSRAFPTQLYVLAFSSVDGTVGRLGGRVVTRIPTTARGSLEDLFARTGAAHAFLDLSSLPRAHYLRTTELEATCVNATRQRARWPLVFDGVMFSAYALQACNGASGRSQPEILSGPAAAAAFNQSKPSAALRELLALLSSSRSPSVQQYIEGTLQAQLSAADAFLASFTDGRERPSPAHQAIVPEVDGYAEVRETTRLALVRGSAQHSFLSFDKDALVYSNSAIEGALAFSEPSALLVRGDVSGPLRFARGGLLVIEGTLDGALVAGEGDMSMVVEGGVAASAIPQMRLFGRALIAVPSHVATTTSLVAYLSSHARVATHLSATPSEVANDCGEEFLLISVADFQ